MLEQYLLLRADSLLMEPLCNMSESLFEKLLKAKAEKDARVKKKEELKKYNQILGSTAWAPGALPIQMGSGFSTTTTLGTATMAAPYYAVTTTGTITTGTTKL